MTTTEKLQRIRARCVELLETSRDNGIDKYTAPAEAGWRGTIASIDEALKSESLRESAYPELPLSSHVVSIITAWKDLI